MNGVAKENGGGRVLRRQETVQQSENKEHNLAVILMFTTVTFLILHSPRYMRSIKFIKDVSKII